MAQTEDVLFEEDIAPDEEFLEWEDTDEGIEIGLDCTKCSAYAPFTLTWEEILALGEGRKVKGFARAATEYRYRYTCPHCNANYQSAGFNEKDALTEATSTIKFSLQEFTDWHSKALGREKAKGKQRRRPSQAQPAQAPQPVVQQAPVQPAPIQPPQTAPAPTSAQQVVQQPAHASAPQTQRGGVRRQKRKLPPEIRAKVQQYVRKLVQQGYGKEEILIARREYAAKLIKAARAQNAQQVQRQVQPQQAAPQLRRMRVKDPKTGRAHVVLVNSANQIVKYLS